VIDDFFGGVKKDAKIDLTMNNMRT